MKNILKDLYNHHRLTRDEAHSILGKIADGEFDPVQVASFLTVFNMRRIDPEELKGFRDLLLDRCLRIDFEEYDPIDMCGTGGDGKNTFNISTLASFVTASCGVPVAKHGNYGVSSVCGSSNVMEYLGYKFTNEEDELREQLAECNITFLHAPLFHPAMKEVAPIRRGLGLPTFFNWLGPMVNPCRPQKQVVGVFSMELQRYYKYIYQQSNSSFAIIHALDGYDEISLTCDTRVSRRDDDRNLTPGDFYSDPLRPADLFGGDSVKGAAEIFLKILKGEGSDAQNKVVAANAAIAINCAQPEKSILVAFENALENILAGTAYSILKKLTKS